MAKWEFLIRVNDQEDLESGHKRSKEGDIIAVKPYPHQWGNCEQNNYLIVIIDNLTQEEVERMQSPFYPEGKYTEDFAEITEQMTEEERLMDSIMRIPIAKRRSNIPLDFIQMGWCPDLDLDKVRDGSIKYQPLKENNIVIDASEKVAIAYDKFRDSFKYSAVKVIQ